MKEKKIIVETKKEEYDWIWDELKTKNYTKNNQSYNKTCAGWRNGWHNNNK